MKRTDATLQHQRRLAKIKHSFLFGYFGRVADTGLGLGRRGQDVTLRQLHERIDDHACAQRSQSVMQRGRGVIGRDRLAGHGDHGAGIETFIHLHQGDAGFGIARLNGTMNRCGTSPAGQQ